MLLRVIGCGVLMLAPPAGAAEIWTGDPIPLIVTVGVERRVVVDGAAEITVGVPGRYAGVISTQAVGASVWVRADDVVDDVRMVVQAPPHNEIIVIELTAVEGVVDGSDVRIVLDSTRAVDPTRAPPGYAALMRYVIKQIYSPERLRDELPGVQPVGVGDLGEISLLRCGGGRLLACGGAVQVTVIGVWRTAVHHATAVRIRNLNERDVELDPRLIRGAWKAAAFVNNWLQAASLPGNTTTLVLISDRPPAEVFIR